MRIYACAANQGNKDTMSQGKRPIFLQRLVHSSFLSHNTHA